MDVVLLTQDGRHSSSISGVGDGRMRIRQSWNVSGVAGDHWSSGVDDGVSMSFDGFFGSNDWKSSLGNRNR